MGLLDKAKQFVSGNKDKVSQGVDKTTDVVDSKTGGKHTDNLQKADDAAAKYAGKTDGADPSNDAARDRGADPKRP